MINKGLFTSNTDLWSTPISFYNELNKQFKFTLDPCCTEDNRKCDKYFTKEDDGLSQSWQGETVFMNPPYGREIVKWVKKAYEESLKPDTKIVMLLPARTDTRWFHDYIYHKSKITFVKGRLKFGDGKNPAPFPSMVVEYY